MEKKILNPTKIGHNVYISKRSLNTSVQSNQITTINNKSIKDSYVAEKNIRF